jgi:hypothetical protein
VSARPGLVELTIADPSGRWEALGFTVRDGVCDLGGVRLRLGAPGRGIRSWALTGIDDSVTDIDGLPTAHADPTPPQPPHATHPNGATALDHVVITTPDFDRTAAALERAGLTLRRVREVPGDGGQFRQGFRRLGPAILELVEIKTADRAGPARFWGLVPIVDDLDALKLHVGDLLTRPKAAVQPGRRIATLAREAGLTPSVAFMTPESGRRPT